MGKRSNFERIEKDQYQTIDPRGVQALAPFLSVNDTFWEPCCGEGLLIDQLIDNGLVCEGYSDLPFDATSQIYGSIFDYFITNPPWSRDILHKIIVNLSDQNPTWLLFDADWIHTKQAIPYLDRLVKIVSVGRLKWIPNTNMSGKDNCAWYLFDVNNTEPTTFYGRS